MGRHLLREFAPPTITQILRNSRHTERVIPNPRLNPAIIARRRIIR
jgi:hypothetical protein